MNRRSFLQLLSAAAGAAVVIPSSLLPLDAEIPAPLGPWLQVDDLKPWRLLSGQPLIQHDVIEFGDEFYPGLKRAEILFQSLATDTPEAAALIRGGEKHRIRLYCDETGIEMQGYLHHLAAMMMMYDTGEILVSGRFVGSGPITTIERR